MEEDLDDSGRVGKGGFENPGQRSQGIEGQDFGKGLIEIHKQADPEDGILRLMKISTRELPDLPLFLLEIETIVGDLEIVPDEKGPVRGHLRQLDQLSKLPVLRHKVQDVGKTHRQIVVLQYLRRGTLSKDPDEFIDRPFQIARRDFLHSSLLRVSSTLSWL